VLNKPYVQNVDSNGRADEVVAFESWANHLQRNQSVVVDLMHGQFKSRIRCPECKVISNCFDPFMICPLPLPQKQQEKVLLYYLIFNNRQKAFKINLKFNLHDHPTAMHLKRELGLLLDVDERRLLLAFLSYKDVETVITDDLPTTEVQALEKNRNLFAIELTQADLGTLHNSRHPGAGQDAHPAQSHKEQTRKEEQGGPDLHTAALFRPKPKSRERASQSLRHVKVHPGGK
jgi:hypothetical protein